MMRTPVLLVLVWATSAWAPQQAPPAIQNARIEARSGAAFARDVAALVTGASEPVWIGWRVPALDGTSNSCCISSYDDGFGTRIIDRGCQIEPAVTPPGGVAAPRPAYQAPAGPVKLEAGTGLVVLVRAIAKHVERVRTLSDDCPMDAGGRAVFWFDAVAGDASVKYLRTLMDQPDGTTDMRRRLGDSALSAIGRHRDGAAEDLLISLAHAPNEAHIRGLAVSSLGQRADKRALSELTAAIANDPDADVRRLAVVGIAKMPKDDAVPALIQLARLSRDLAVRKEAMTWLGQSKDPRALAYFEEIVKK